MNTSSSILTRFAPSPTGKLHVGNVRRALDNWLFARHLGGRFMLRMDDTDPERSKLEYEKEIERDLTWLGLNWDLYARQSDRMEHYFDAAEKLKSIHRLYPCYETAEELDFKRKRLLSRGLPPLYDRAALSLTDAQKKEFEKEGRKPHWRFLLNPTEISWEDAIHGKITFDAQKLGDPILIKSDGLPVYSLASVVDDLAFHVTHIIRGEDHITNTAIQIQMIEALGENPKSIQFAHLPLLTDISGGGLSKRHGSLSLESLRGDSIDPMAINSLLSRLGSSDPIEPFLSLNDLVSQFEIQKFARSTPKFDVHELEHLNAKLLHMMPYDLACQRFEDHHISGISEILWDKIKGNISRITEVSKWKSICQDMITTPVFSPEDTNYLKTALDLLPPLPWNMDTWKIWTEALKAATGRKGKLLYMPLRLALTGEEHGPEMKDILPLLGHALCLKRLKVFHA